MKLYEVLCLGDDNILGGLAQTAINNLKRAQKVGDKDIKALAKDVLQLLNNIQQNPNIIMTDAYTVMKYLQMLSNKKLDKKTLQSVADAFSSYDDSAGD